MKCYKFDTCNIVWPPRQVWRLKITDANRLLWFRSTILPTANSNVSQICIWTGKVIVLDNFSDDNCPDSLGKRTALLDQMEMQRQQQRAKRKQQKAQSKAARERNTQLLEVRKIMSNCLTTRQCCLVKPCSLGRADELAVSELICFNTTVMTEWASTMSTRNSHYDLTSRPVDRVRLFRALIIQ